MADIAVMIENWADDPSKGDTLDLDKAVIVVREYARHRQLTSAECELLPDFVLLYLLCDSSEYVRGRLERGVDGNTAVNECEVYKQYLHHAQATDWSAALRQGVREL